jgi:hypothetical protein
MAAVTEDVVGLLEKMKGKVSHLNVREEKHGEESVMAVDVKVVLDLANEFLDRLSPGLREALYAPQGTPQLDGVEVPLTVLRFPQLGDLDWEFLMVKGAFVLHGAKKADDLLFEGDIKKALKLSCKEGGTVEVTVQVAVLPEPDELAKLSTLLGRQVKVSVRPVEQPVQPPLEA